jgi:hypothetical protein
LAVVFFSQFGVIWHGDNSRRRVPAGRSEATGEEGTAGRSEATGEEGTAGRSVATGEEGTRDI